MGAIDSTGLASVIGQAIHQVDTSTGVSKVFVGPPQGMAVDLAFGPDGTLYVVELDEASWAIDLGLPGLGGTVNACSPFGCSQVATGLPLPMAAAVDRRGTVYAAINALVPGAAEVIALP